VNLTDKTILITGATSGIGEKLVEKLAPLNRTIIAIGRNDEKLSALRERHKNITTYRIRLENHEEVIYGMYAIWEANPDLSVIFNNAAIQHTPFISSPDFNPDSIQTELEVNLHAPISICALSLPHFLSMNKPTAFINLSSGLALSPKAASSVYCATKAAIHSFSQSFRYQLENTNVSVFEVLLPLVDTPMTHGRRNKKISAEKAVSAILRGIKRDQYEIYVGIAKLLPIMSRLAPTLMKQIMKKG